MDSQRLFVGLELPPAHQAIVAGLPLRLGPMLGGPATWTREGNAHVTLKFLGNVGRERLEAVTAALAAISFAPFVLAPGGGGFFPGPARPRVVWAGFTAGAPQCTALAAAVDAALVPVGFAAEARPFAAHLTLCRIKAPGRGGDVAGILALLDRVEWPAIPVQALTLFASQPTPDGLRYPAVARFAASPG